MRYSAAWLGFLGCAWALNAAPAKPLAIQRVTLSQYEDGPAVPGDYRFVPGEAIFFSFQVSGYRAIGDEDPKVAIDYTIEAQDPAGIPIVEAYTGNLEATLDPEDKNWMPKVRRTISIPPSAPSGEYRILISLRDRVGVNRISGQAAFRVEGHAIEASETLAVRNFHFYRREEDAKPLTVAAYKAGDTIWARFEMTGYKLGEKNRFEVGYGLVLLRPNGDTMFRQEDAAAEKEESFYPRRWLPAALSLNLNKDVRPGVYTLVLMVSDKVGGQKTEARQTFSVE